MYILNYRNFPAFFCKARHFKDNIYNIELVKPITSKAAQVFMDKSREDLNEEADMELVERDQDGRVVYSEFILLNECAWEQDGCEA